MIITPVTHPNFPQLSNAVFLAGTCPKQGESDWRNEAINILLEAGFEGDIINPYNPNYSNDILEKQTKWEYQGMCYASYILFWIPRDDNHLALTTNMELGEWLNSSNIVVGFPPNSKDNDYVREKLKSHQKDVYDTLKDACLEVARLSNRKPQYFFTSDTHFSAERTFKLSYRPFYNVEDMDLRLISNWNKRITKNDLVIHLGDFGNPEVLKFLNFQKMFFLQGNYERNDESILKEILKDKRVTLIDNKQKIKLKGQEYYLCHEPLNDMGEDNFYLYGHIHRLQLVKRNGINVGVDANRFMPVSVSEIAFLRGGIDIHFDENVFSETCF